ncbi:MAG: DUF459 domain-containing protein [Hyphomicrobium sp.]|nr:DUF459 domain-containing protein [Hyphomicrobium sp.]
MLDTIVRGTAALLAAVVILACIAVAIARPAAAQDEASGSSYLTPFPKGEVYRVVVIGDDLAEGLLYGLVEGIGGDARLQIRPRPFSINGIMRADLDEKLVALEEDLKVDTPDIVIAMMGAWDRVTLRDQKGKRLPIGSPEWQKAYSQRADRLMKMLKRRNVAVYWAGLPNVRRYEANEDAQMMNEILRERVYLNGFKFVDTFASFLDENGGFNAWGPDLTGKIVRLRDGEGVYFTTAGNQKLAHFVGREIRRDLTQAKAARVVPLAGSEAEQSKINPGKAVIKDEAKAGAAEVATAAQNVPAEAPGALHVEQKADNGKINLKTIDRAGRQETVTIEIVRPAIPASVVALVTRKESADTPSRMGEVLVDRLSGGLSTMSTVTPPAAGAGVRGGRLLPSQSPYYRVLVKGERLTPRPGRADDFSWPKTAPPSQGASGSGEARPSPLETGTTADTP